MTDTIPLVVTGSFEVAPADRDAFIESMSDIMRRSRTEAGCIDYTFAPDPLEPGRVVLCERWESRAHLDAHLAAMTPPANPVPTVSREVLIHEVASTERLG